MSASQLHRKLAGDKSGGGSRAGSGSSASSVALEQHPEFSNSFLAQALVNQAGEQMGGSVEPWMVGFGEDPDKFIFAEDGDDLDVQGGDRARQRDALPGLRPKHEGKEYEDFESGTAFVKGAGDTNDIEANDAIQGALGDCYLIAGMAAVARAQPDAIRDIIKDNGDGTFDVTLYLRSSRYSRPRAVTQTVDSRLAVKSAGKTLYAGTGDSSGGETELWAALIEKTVAQHKDSYDLISGGNINGGGFVFAGASELLTGKPESYMRVDNMDNDEVLLYIALALEDKQPVVASTRNIKDDEDLTRDAKKHNVYWNHAYAPESVDLDAGTITLQNPWGSHHVADLSIDDFRRFYKALRIGSGG